MNCGDVVGVMREIAIQNFMRSVSEGGRARLALKPKYAEVIARSPAEMCGIGEDLKVHVTEVAIESQFLGGLEAIKPPRRGRAPFCKRLSKPSRTSS
jgi:hypothetical protein